MSNPAQGAVGAETKFKIGDRVQIICEPNDCYEPGQITSERDGWFEVTWTQEDGLTYGEGLFWWQPHELRLLPAVDAALASPRADSGERTAGEDLDDRLRAAGMFTIPEMMGETPLTRWEVDAGMMDLDFFERWLEAQVRQYLHLKARYDLGDKDESDELYEWTLAHVGAFRAILVNFKAARKATPAQPAGAVPDSLRALSEEEIAEALYEAVPATTASSGRQLSWSEVKTLTGHPYPLLVEGHRKEARAVLALLASHPAGQSAGSGTEGSSPRPWTFGPSDNEVAAQIYDATGVSVCEFWSDKPNRDADAALIVAAVNAARPAAPEAQGSTRQPIETAPKDRSQILLFGVLKDSRAEPAWFIGAWFPIGEHGEGWWVSSCVEVIATEWAPLPAPPASSGQGGR